MGSLVSWKLDKHIIIFLIKPIGRNFSYETDLQKLAISASIHTIETANSRSCNRRISNTEKINQWKQPTGNKTSHRNGWICSATNMRTITNKQRSQHPFWLPAVSSWSPRNQQAYSNWKMNTNYQVLTKMCHCMYEWITAIEFQTTVCFWTLQCDLLPRPMEGALLVTRKEVRPFSLYHLSLTSQILLIKSALQTSNNCPIMPFFYWKLLTLQLRILVYKQRSAYLTWAPHAKPINIMQSFNQMRALKL